MHILLSNDDGYAAPGLAVLAAAMQRFGRVTVVAPEQDRSGASNSLTLDRPLVVKQAENGFYYVNGTPTDCVHLAVTGLLETQPDMVISGINHGANMGDDTLYSGTVAAATEGYLLGVPALAVSMVGKSGQHFETAAALVTQLVEKHQKTPLPSGILLNINVPDKPLEALKGFKITRLGRRHKAEPAIRSTNPRGETIYWVGPPGAAQDNGEGTDFYAVAHDYVSLSPLQMDLTAFDRLREVGTWITP